MNAIIFDFCEFQFLCTSIKDKYPSFRISYTSSKQIILPVRMVLRTDLWKQLDIHPCVD